MEINSDHVVWVLWVHMIRDYFLLQVVTWKQARLGTWP